jgi:2-oxoglutarate dehydrogenase E2 component (dihydrolipoamide succinyltransferase)
MRERFGLNLTYLPFVARAVCAAIADFPYVNATFEDGRLIARKAVNLGIAVDLDHQGLVVPIVRDAEGMTVRGLAVAIAGAIGKARAGKLGPADLEGGTYSISNNGSNGTLFTAPIINAPQVAILSMDSVMKKPVVLDSENGPAIAVRPVAILGQSFDHRAFDGAYAAAFLRRLKQVLETRDWQAELH